MTMILNNIFRVRIGAKYIGCVAIRLQYNQQVDVKPRKCRSMKITSLESSITVDLEFKYVSPGLLSREIVDKTPKSISVTWQCQKWV